MRVLIADDEPRVLLHLQSLISGMDGFEVTGTAADGREAVELLRSGNFDIAVTDIQMPKLSGLDMIREIRQLNLPVVCIILSGYDDFEYAKTAMRLGIHQYLLKPVDRSELCEALRQASEELEHSRNVQKRLDREALAQREQEFMQLLHAQRTEVSQGFPYGPYGLFIADIRTDEPFDMEEVLSEFRDAEHLVISSGEGRIAMLSWVDEDQQLIARRFHDCLRLEGASVQVVYAEDLADAQSVCQAYRQISRVLESGWMIRGNSVSRLEDVTFDLHANALASLHKWSHTELDQAIRDENHAEIESQVHRFFALIRNTKADDATVRSYFIEEIIHTMKLVTDTGGDAESILEGMRNIPEMLRTYSMNTLEDWYLSLCRSIAKYLGEMKQRRPGSVSQQILERFRANPAGDYSLSELAGTFYMSPVYLGQLFKKETGETLHAYLTQERIRLSMQKLRETDEAVYEIAESVGYQNLRSFYTAFRKAEGCSPNEYREQYRKQKN